MKRLLIVLGLLSTCIQIGVARAEPLTPNSAPATALPKHVDLRGAFSQWGLPIKPQLRRDTCAVFTFAGALEWALAKGTGERGVRLSEEYLNWAANQVAGDTEDGASYEDLIAAFDKWGICDERLMPYQNRYTGAVPRQDAFTSARRVWELGFKRHWIAQRTENGLTDAHIAQMKKVLASGFPLCAYGRDHSILLVGYVEDSRVPHESYFITRNSATRKYETIYCNAAKEEFGSVLWIELPIKETGR